MSSLGQSWYGAEPAAGRKLRHDIVPVVEDLVPLFDVLLLLAAAYASAWFYVLMLAPQASLPVLWSSLGEKVLVVSVLAPFLLYYRRTPHKTGPRWPLVQLPAFEAHFLKLVGLVLCLGVVTRSLDAVPRVLLVLWLGLSFVLTLSCRAGVAAYLRRLERKGILCESVAVVGAGPVADRLIRYLLQLRPHSIRIVGVFDDYARDERPGTFGCTGSIADLIALGQRRPIDWVLITLPGTAEDRLKPMVHALKSLAVTVALCPQNIGLSTAPQDIEYVADDLPVTLLADRPIKRWNEIIKSAEDFICGGILTMALLPLMALVALAIKLDSPGPVLFKQRRHTSNNVEFDVLKFRTMRWCPQADDGVLRQTCRNDERITRLGQFLRRSSLDELPQLFNVLRGEMSLVGPRPHAVNMRTEQRLGHEIIATYPHRHRVKPGITGWSQVNGSRGATETAEQLRRRIELDLYYVEHWSLAFDLKILLMTVWVVLRGTNAR